METEKRKISKRTIIIAAILIILLGLPAIYFLTIKNQEDTRASWYSSSWMYRRAISVSGAGVTRSNEDVLITVDTATLTTAKLQADCDDLRFVDSDDSTALSYWVEGGCDTTTTQVWVRIPSLPAGGKTIYMYYGNPTIGNAEASWTGNFITLADTACANGWARDTTYDGRFIYGSTSYGSTGGGSLSHNHGGTFNVTSSGASASGGVGGDSDYLCPNPVTATHQISGSISAVDSTPQYINTYVCKKNDLSTLNNLIMFSASSTPSGWTRASAFDNRFPVGSASYGTTGGSTTHSHTISGLSVAASTQTQCSDIDSPSPNGRGIARWGHIHTASVSSNPSASNNPPYKNLLFIKAPTLATLNQTVITMGTATPPLGWTQYSTMNNYFLMGSGTVNTSAQGSSTHSHSISLSTGGPSSTLWKNASSIPIASDAHTHTASLNLNNSNIPSYATTIYIQRKTSLAAALGPEVVINTTPTAPTALLTEGATNPIGVTDTTPEFSAIFNDPDTGDTAIYYEIEVNDHQLFIGNTYWDSGKTSISPINKGSRSPDITYAGYPITPDGYPYYWRIRFWDQDDAVSPWSSTASFTMNRPPEAPSSLLTENQTNPIGVKDTTPEFSAIYTDNNSNPSGYYQIQVNTSSAFTGTTMWDSGQISITTTSGARTSDISYSGTTLTLNGQTYYWRMRFWDSLGTVGNWSSTANFTMNIAPDAPTVLWTEGSANQIKVTDLTPEFSAIFSDSNAIDTGTYYELQVNTQSDFQGTVMWQSGPTAFPTPIANGARSSDISYAGTTLTLDGNTYYWRIRMWDQYLSVSDWSSTSQFIMSGPPYSPTGLEVDGQTNPIYLTTTNPTFSAIHLDPNQDSALYYEIEVNSNSSFTGTVMWDTGKTSMTSTAHNARMANVTYAGTPLTNTNNTYYWRIRFWDTDDNTGAWSSTATFQDNSTHLFMNGLKLDGIQIDPIVGGPPPVSPSEF